METEDPIIPPSVGLIEFNPQRVTLSEEVSSGRVVSSFLNNTVPSDAIYAARASFAAITSSKLENSDLQ